MMFDEMTVCAECGEELSVWDDGYEVKGEQVCESCYRKALKETFNYEDALKVGERNKVTIEINGFLWSLINRNINEIEDLIKRDWFSGTEKNDVEDYVNEIGYDEWEDELYRANHPKRYELPFEQETEEALSKLTIRKEN